MDEAAEPTAPASRKPSKRRSLKERLEAAKAREVKAAETLRRRKVKLQKYESQERSLGRKLDTRRKIIAGALALEHMRRGGGFRATMLELLDEYVVKDDERGLFGMDALPADDRRRIDQVQRQAGGDRPATPGQVGA